MLRLITLLLAACLLLLAACGGDDDDGSDNGDGPEALTTDSTIQELQDRFNSSVNLYSTLHGTVTAQTASGQTFTEEVWYEAGQSFRSFLQGDLTGFVGYRPQDIRIKVADGAGQTDVYLFQQETSRWCKAKVATAAAPLLTLALPFEMDFSKGKIEAEETVAGRPALKVQRDTTIAGFYVWVDAQYGVILKQLTDSDQVLVTESGFTDIEYNTEIDDSLFDPAIPSGFTEGTCEELTTS